MSPMSGDYYKPPGPWNRLTRDQISTLLTQIETK